MQLRLWQFTMLFLHFRSVVFLDSIANRAMLNRNDKNIYTNLPTDENHCKMLGVSKKSVSLHQPQSVTLSVADRFSKFFHWHTVQKICNKIVIKDSTTPK